VKEIRMERRRLGSSDLSITPLGFGAWAAGGGNWQFGWGPQDDEASVRAIHRAVDCGLNWVDTAAVYGLGHSEEVVGRAVAALPAARRPYVFTKCSLVWNETRTVTHVLRADSIRREAEASLRRLGVDAIDLYQIHWPRWPASPPGHDPGAYEEAWGTLAELRREGKVRWIGVSNFTVEQLARAHAIAPIASLQPPYSILRRAIEAEVLPWCQANGVGVIVYSPMLSGMLSGRMTRERVAAFAADDWRRNSPNFQEPALSRNLGVAAKLAEIGARHGRSAGEVAIGWTLRHPAVTGAIVGARSPEQVDGIVGAGVFALGASEAHEIESFLEQVSA
jgi:aryl-alcohol dehydrogenase-like predicted oxidoreductase